MVPTKVVDKIDTRSFSSENRVFYEIIWTNILGWGWQRMATWRTIISLWIPKATDINSPRVILTAFPLHEVLHERVSVLRLYVHCLPC
jgi:hypothetical protein